ncbi:MAG TPA: TlyA family RNA methyltransferase [Clostridia bacterium]|nr:TlyA family RNA methyltransferase [Clostridia bacterium]
MKKRLDLLLVERGLAPDIAEAQALIMAGRVYASGQKADKSGEDYKDTTSIEIRGHALRYVSRGGLKLEKALATFPLRLTDCICCDFGASTGGFTDCMLQNDAKKVYAFDVGYGQLAWSLRQDPRVINRERTNVRHLTHEDVSELIDFISIDVSFISLALVLPVAYKLLKFGGSVICLIKPQFEAERDQVGKKGVVSDQNVHLAVIEKVMNCAKTLDFSVKGLSFSPVKGPEGNIEYLLYLVKEIPGGEPEGDALKIVEDAHQTLSAT